MEQDLEDKLQELVRSWRDVRVATGADRSDSAYEKGLERAADELEQVLLEQLIRW